MSNIMFIEGKNGLLKGTFGDITAGSNIKLALITNGGSFTNQTQYSSIVGINIVAGSSVILGGKGTTTPDNTNGNKFYAGNPTITGVLSGISVTGYIVYFDDGLTKKLISYTDSGTGLPFTTNGGNITITFSGSGVFAL